jgi:hypothetical protein
MQSVRTCAAVGADVADAVEPDDVARERAAAARCGSQ